MLTEKRSSSLTLGPGLIPDAPDPLVSQPSQWTSNFAMSKTRKTSHRQRGKNQCGSSKGSYSDLSGSVVMWEQVWERREDKAKKLRYINMLDDLIGGWGGIRTHEAVARLPVFKTGAFNRSATHPFRGGPYRSRRSRGSAKCLERWILNRNRMCRSISCLRIGFIRKPVSTFRSDALAAAPDYDGCAHGSYVPKLQTWPSGSRQMKSRLP